MKIHGLCPPVTTPFTADGALEEAAFREDIRFIVEDAGVHGLAVMVTPLHYEFRPEADEMMGFFADIATGPGMLP
ncbi:MAG TPA: hypothetical protein QGG37_11825 [Chloroflexota bacterium]|nr:hypothetical protein [Chloroflexota bacterium]